MKKSKSKIRSRESTTVEKKEEKEDTGRPASAGSAKIDDEKDKNTKK